MRRVIFNQKGGVGKTSIACNLAAAFAQLGQKTLLIDLDAQANSSQYILGDKYKKEKNIAHFFESTLSFKLFKDSLTETVHSTDLPALKVIPPSRELADLQPKLENRYKIMKLNQAIDVVESILQIDQVLMDTPPALNFYTMSALLAADRVLIPHDCDQFSAQAISQVIQTVEEVRSDYKPSLRVEGIIINNLQKQAKLPQTQIAELEASGLSLLTPFISASVAIKESHTRQRPLVLWRPSHRLAKEFKELAAHLLMEPNVGLPKNLRNNSNNDQKVDSP